MLRRTALLLRAPNALRWLAMFFAAVFVAAPAAADVDYLIERPIVTMNLEYQDKEENRSGPSVDTRNEQTTSFWQRLEVQSRGWFYHPDLLLFSFGLEPLWKQQDTAASDSFSRDDDDTFLGYYLDAQVLRQKRHSFKLFLRQSRNEFNSTLSPDNITETDIARAVWLINSKLLPTTVTLESNDTNFSDFFSTRDNSDILRLETKHRSEKHQFNFLSEYVDQFRQIDVQSFDIDRFMTNINSNYSFSDQTRLTSTIFSLNSDSELSDSKSFLWSERLMLQHRPNLRSEYTARFDSRENDNFRSETRYLSGALEHQLYENLTTRIELYSSNDDFDNGEIDIGEADLDLRYVREIPIGMLSITGGYAYRIEDNNIDAESSQVLNEPHTLSGTSPEFLSRSRIDPNSVIVSDATKAVTYVEGIDYVLSIVGDSVGIERSIFGGIADGETVLVDYIFATQAPFEADRRAGRVGVNLNLWRTLRLYYNFNRIEESLISGTRPTDLSDDRITRAGASLRWRWSTTTADYEMRDTVRTPLTRKRLQQSFAFRMNRSLSFGVSASYSETDFREIGSDSRSIGFSGNLRWNMGRWGRFEIDAFSRDIDGESQKTRSNGLISMWSIRYGDWSGFVRFEDLDESDDLTIQTRDRRLITIHVSRIFR
jgi:hypothetical protein